MKCHVCFCYPAMTIWTLKQMENPLERLVTHPGLKARSTRYLTCTLTSMPKSLACCQSTYISVVTALRHTALPFREACPCISHRYFSNASPATPNIRPLSQGTPHTGASSISGVPHTGVKPNPWRVPHMAHTLSTPPMASWRAIPLLTPNGAKGEISHPSVLKARSTRYQTSTLTTTPKSQARWYGSQSADSPE